VWSAHSNGFRVFADRQEAGRALAEWFLRYPPGPNPIVLGLPRGGVPVAFELARALDLPLDVLMVRKIGVPFNPELAAGAIASGGIAVYNRDVLRALGLREEDLAETVKKEEAELRRREATYRTGPAPDLAGRTVVLVDDGIATGATMGAAVAAVRAARPRAVIAASPTASREAVTALEVTADTIAVLQVPEPYVAVGAWYTHFPQLSDDEVVLLLSRARESRQRSGVQKP
jgi:putative phosphoribosyl transferase